MRRSAVSAVTGEGLEELLARLGEMSKTAQAEEPEATPYVVLRPGRPRFTVTREGRGWRVKGQNVERLLLETDLDDEIQLAKFQKRLVREGIERRLAELGANPGDEVAIGDRVFEFIPDAPARSPGSRGWALTPTVSRGRRTRRGSSCTRRSTRSMAIDSRLPG